MMRIFSKLVSILERTKSESKSQPKAEGDESDEYWFQY